MVEVAAFVLTLGCEEAEDLTIRRKMSAGPGPPEIREHSQTVGRRVPDQFWFSVCVVLFLAIYTSRDLE